MTNLETSKELKKEAISTQDGQNDESNGNDKDVYFLILRPSEEKIDFTGLNYETKYKIEPKIIYQKRIDKGNETYLEEIVFKFKKKTKKKEKEGQKESTKSTKYSITFLEGDHTYEITFPLKNERFVYQPDLKIGNK